MEGDVDFRDPAEALVFFEGFAAAAEGVFVDFVLGGCCVSEGLGGEWGRHTLIWFGVSVMKIAELVSYVSR